MAYLFSQPSVPVSLLLPWSASPKELVNSSLRGDKSLKNEDAVFHLEKESCLVLIIQRCSFPALPPHREAVAQQLPEQDQGVTAGRLSPAFCLLASDGFTKTLIVHLGGGVGGAAATFLEKRIGFCTPTGKRDYFCENLGPCFEARGEEC